MESPELLALADEIKRTESRLRQLKHERAIAAFAARAAGMTWAELRDSMRLGGKRSVQLVLAQGKRTHHD